MYVEFSKTRALFGFYDVNIESSGEKVSIIHAVQLAGILYALLLDFPIVYKCAI